VVGRFWRRRSRPGCGVRWGNRKGEHTYLVDVTEDDLLDCLGLSPSRTVAASDDFEFGSTLTVACVHKVYQMYASPLGVGVGR